MDHIDPSMFTGDEPWVIWEQYRGAKEELPPRIPRAWGRSVEIASSVDALHAANKVTRCYHTWYVIFLNVSPIIWYWKFQNRVESSTFPSEFIAMKKDFISIYFSMVNTLNHWIRVLFGDRFRIPLRRLSGFWGIGFRVPLRGLSSFWVTPGLVVPAHPLLVPVRRYFEFSTSFFVALTYMGLIALWCHIGWRFVA